MEIVNKLDHTILTNPADYSNRYLPTKEHGILMSRYCASWLHVGGKYNDRDGFIEWMTNIPFVDKAGNKIYISRSDALDAYWCMKCGKSELEYYAMEYLHEHECDKRGYVITTSEKELLKKES